MCGVTSIVYARDNRALGREAAALVKHLEYRGYDSTGVATIAGDGAITLRKAVGAPSRVVRTHDIESMQGQKAIGQVRWATYGSVTDANAQPHEVSCKVHMVGAHNGNISNADALKEFLQAQGHAVVSDNDGEMLVHVIEHHFAGEGGTAEGLPTAERRAIALRAIRKANATVIGSYAACVSLPGIPGVFALKAGSSLYAGKGSDAAGDFIVVSSDLTSVLSKTRFLIPLAEGEGLHFTDHAYTVFSLTAETETVPALRRSRLGVTDIALHPPYRFFMEQEIAQTPANLEPLLRYDFPRESERAAFGHLEGHAEDARGLVFDLLKLAQIADETERASALAGLLEDTRLARLTSRLALDARDDRFISDEAALFQELRAKSAGALDRLRALDLMVLWERKRRVLQARDALLVELPRAPHVYLLGAGTSYNACLTGAAFFDRVAGLVTYPANPGLFRSTYLHGLKKGDLVIAVTQSGETKDLVDVFGDIRSRYGRDVHLVALVNNENSTIPQERADFFLPLLCGPEIAVAATKSFVSQVAIFYLLAWRLREGDAAVAARVERVRACIASTLTACDAAVSEVAARLYLKPSIHILGTSLLGLAREGALKVREVVLNHTEGYDAAEFKHGPNTILGKNTLFSIDDLEKAFADGASAGPGARPDFERYFANYPLVFVCPPEERDVRITISQIHTHKIRGTDVVVIAEEDEALRRAALGRPAAVRDYDARYVAVPATGDPDLFVFQAAVVLQTLALKMSVLKMEHLDRLGVADHGVHPDVPKNVSKSITVD